MTTFIQLHMLTAYPPANLNRDDLGRPKTARMGGVERLRISSQSLKRSWRTSDLFEEALKGHTGTRTKRLGTEVFDRLTSAGVKENKAREWARSIANVFGALKKEGTEIEQLAHVGPEERQAVMDLADTLAKENREATQEELALLRKQPHAADIGLFGRMLAADPAFNIEAACQVAHAISVHPVTIEDDYFTAVDDLNEGDQDMGAAHIGETGFAAGLFYSYICISRDQLVANLDGDEALADRAIGALTEAAVKVAPRGKQNSFGSRAYASYVLAEKGPQQPRSLAVAFLKPVHGYDHGDEAVKAITNQRKHFNDVYGACADEVCELNALTGEGSLDALKQFVTQH
jgi:CRISPR system Cascade subunit CasC